MNDTLESVAIACAELDGVIFAELSESGDAGCNKAHYRREAAKRIASYSPSRLSANDEGVTGDYDAQALKGAAEFFEGIATGSGPAPLAFAQAIRRVLSALPTKPEGVKRDFEEAASYLERIAEEVPRGHESVARGRSTYNWLTHCAKLLRSNSTTTAEDAGPVKKTYSGNPYDIPYTKVPEDWDDLHCLPEEDHHAYVKGWKQGLKQAEQIAVEMRKVHGSSTGDAYKCGVWDQGVRIAAAIRNTADCRNIATQPPTPASGEQMEVVAWGTTDEDEDDYLITFDVLKADLWGAMGRKVIPLVTLEAANKAIADRDAEIERLKKENDFLGDDAVAAWKKCEERRLAQVALGKRIERLEKALEWYASPEAWTIDQVEGPDGDYGRRATEALADQGAQS